MLVLLLFFELRNLLLQFLHLGIECPRQFKIFGGNRVVLFFLDCIQFGFQIPQRGKELFQVFQFFQLALQLARLRKLFLDNGLIELRLIIDQRLVQLGTGFNAKGIIASCGLLLFFWFVIIVVVVVVMFGRDGFVVASLGGLDRFFGIGRGRIIFGRNGIRHGPLGLFDPFLQFFQSGHQVSFFLQRGQFLLQRSAFRIGLAGNGVVEFRLHLRDLFFQPRPRERSFLFHFRFQNFDFWFQPCRCRVQFVLDQSLQPGLFFFQQGLHFLEAVFAVRIAQFLDPSLGGNPSLDGLDSDHRCNQ
mmetsp:Transcript_21787/g.32971  ORF Transcript_21787/g.32971 Transcript_21787/m.32971 type:complete len:302 (-) Transcript_21787:2180-3085(-)